MSYKAGLMQKQGILMKKPISATIEEDLIQWIDSRLKDKTKYRNKSHLIEIALEMLKKSEEGKGK